jgi:hypothetical protein
MDDYYEIETTTVYVHDERFYEPILKSETNIDIFGDFKVWEILVCLLGVFLVLRK